MLAAAKELATSARADEVRFVRVEERHGSTTRRFASMVVRFVNSMERLFFFGVFCLSTVDHLV